ncbi:MAG: glycosyltransferase family 4 protein [Chitinophagales bacterium]|nr:glycosyltransferase family 4 protein [Chitinophagales bacterium]
MKVCHLTSVHPPFDTRIFVKECSSLAAAGFNVTLVAPALKDEMKNGVQVIAVNKKSARLQRMISTVNAVVKKALEVNADIYHIHDPELLRAGLKLRKKHYKVIYDAHEDVPRQLLAKHYLPSFSRKILSASFEKYENHAAARFNGVITVTPLLEQRFSEVNSNTAQVCNFPSLQEFPDAAADWKERKNEICYIGNITAIRGIREMIKSLEYCDTRLHLGGSFSPAQLREEITNYPAWSKVTEHGFMSRLQVKQTLSACKAGLVLLHPAENYIEAYPVKMFEYMAAGIPVVASDFPSWKEIVNRHQCGICVDPLNIHAIADAINYLKNNDAIAQQMGRNGRKAIESTYNWEQEERKLISFYHQLMNQS